jgi:hypothetical protein
MADEYVTHDEMDAATRHDGVGVALIYVTTILLLVGIYLMQAAAKDKFNTGMFGGGAAPAPAGAPAPAPATK